MAMASNIHWEEEDFLEEIQAWMFGLKLNKESPIPVSLEFSNWQLRGNKYLTRRYLDGTLEIHIVYSVIHACPLLLVRYVNDPQRIPKIVTSSAFIGAFEYHPVLDQVFFGIHGCETRSWMSLLLDNNVKSSPPGVALLSWFSVIANQALGLGLSPGVFVQAKSMLETYHEQQKKTTADDEQETT
jgi:hypothetical protein